jgi:hypothetical protein
MTGTTGVIKVRKWENLPNGEKYTTEIIPVLGNVGNLTHP